MAPRKLALGRGPGANTLAIVASLQASVACSLLTDFGGLAGSSQGTVGPRADAGTDAEAEAADARSCAGACGCFAAPVTLAQNERDPRGLVVDGSDLYWASPSAHAVRRVPKTGGPAATLGSTATAVHGVTLDPLNVYWIGDTNGGCDPLTGLFSEAKANGATTRVQSCTDALFTARGIANDALNVYWTNPGESSVYAASKGNGGVISLAGMQGAPESIAVNATAVFWTTTATQQIVRWDKGSGAVDVLASSQRSALGIAADEGTVFFTTATAVLAIDGRARDAGSPTPLASAQDAPTAIAIDARCVYWTTAGDGAVWAIPKTGGAAARLAAGQNTPQALAVDASGVYWANATGEIVGLSRQ